MARPEGPAHARLLKRSADAERARSPQAPTQEGRCPGAAAQLLAVHRTLRRGPVLQLKAGGAPRAAPANRTGLPDRLKAGVEALSGVSLDGVKVHYNSSKPARLNALAYAQGDDIHLAPGEERHLPHEAWHVVQQAQGRVRPTLRMKGGITVNDERSLEHEADVLGATALRCDLSSESGGPALAANGLGAAGPAQMKKTLNVEGDFPGKGKLNLDFEERASGSGVGMYGVIGFMPDRNSQAVTNKIDLVQIASLRANHEDVEQQTEFATAGEPQVKDMWRVNDKFHIDLLGSESGPRREMSDKVIEESYNSERRNLEEDKRLDKVTMSNTGDVLNEQSLANMRAQGVTPPETTTKKITQSPGFNHGGGDVRKTELFDFPQGSKPAIASFHTTVDADGAAWATVEWGFRSKEHGNDGYLEIESVDWPEFSEGQTPEMKAARQSFNAIMANPSAWTSPEALDEVTALLQSDKDTDYEEGKRQLRFMAEGLATTIRKIRQASARQPEENLAESKGILKKFLGPHVTMLKEVLGKLYQTRQDDNDMFDSLVELFDSATEQLA